MRKSSSLVLVGGLFLSLANVVLGQGADAALKDRVAQLIERLGGEDRVRRDQAIDDLTRLGPRILPLLPEAGSISDARSAEALEAVRKALAESARRANLGASVVTIQGEGIRLSEAIRILQQQSGNRITDLREQFGQDVTNPTMDLDLVETPFFSALDAICDRAGLTPNFYTGDGSIGLMIADDPAMRAPGSAMPDSAPERRLVYSGPFRVQLQQVAARRDFVSGAAEASARLEVAWEPRLRPMLLGISAADIVIKDDRGDVIQPTVEEQSGSIVLRPENPVAEVNLNMNAPNREARTLEELTVKAQVTLPGGVRSFRFDDLSKPGKQTVDDVSIQLVSVAVEDFVWKVRIILQYPGEGPAFESYQQGLFNNSLWLQKADGTRFEQNGGFSNLGSDRGRIGFEYLFVDVPGEPSDWGLIYETPSSVETIPLEFQFKDVPLP